jgi:hypothetical protein
MDPNVGPVFSGDDAGVSAAQDMAITGYVNAVSPYMSTGDIAGFLNIFYQIFYNQPLIYQQAMNNPYGQQVYDYYDQIVAMSPGLTEAGMSAYYYSKDIQNWPDINTFMSVEKIAWHDPLNDKAKIESLFTDPSFLSQPFQVAGVTWNMVTGFLNHMGDPYQEGVDTYAYWQEVGGQWYRADLDKNIVAITGPPWLSILTPFGGGPGSY